MQVLTLELERLGEGSARPAAQATSPPSLVFQRESLAMHLANSCDTMRHVREKEQEERASPSKLARDTKFCVTATVSEMLRTACHQPEGTNIVSPVGRNHDEGDSN